MSNELAKELGYDAGFSKGTYPYHVASFIVRELAARMAERARRPARPTPRAHPARMASSRPRG